MNPSLSQTIPFPAGIGFIVVVVACDGVVVEISDVVVVGDGEVAFDVLEVETVVDATAAVVVELGAGVLVGGLALEEVPFCWVVVSGSSIGTRDVVVTLGLVGLPSVVD